MHIPAKHYRVLSFSQADPIFGDFWPHNYAPTRLGSSKFDAHLEAAHEGVGTCSDVGGPDAPNTLGELWCSACAVNSGKAIMVKWDTDGDLSDGGDLGREIRLALIRRAHIIAQHHQGKEPAPSDLALAQERISFFQDHVEVLQQHLMARGARITELEARVLALEEQALEYEREVIDLGMQVGLMDGADWEPLGENIFGHCVLPMREPHEDGRSCVWHARLDAWVFDNEKKCLREHPDVLEMMTRQPARDGGCLVPGACPDPKTGMPCNNCWLAERSTIPPNPFK